MKPFIIFLLIATFFQIGTSTLLAQSDADTAFPRIENNPNIDLDRLENSEPEPDNMKPEKKKTAATWGKNQSFFSNIIQGFAIGFFSILAWAGYRKWQNKNKETEIIDEE